ncbi:neuronal PAS domain-containing protein 4-like [Latimeria chalumnae]|uniref:neuronal PAS domain-containing protein 4-like n=1 Tax=Latimeria chalumnae TaxID=7897 RepID=UPI00313A7BCD
MRRSTKGASKARRDQINSEIRNLRALLPIPQDEKERLSYLHTMALVCIYIRKAACCQGLLKGMKLILPLPGPDCLQAVPGGPDCLQAVPGGPDCLQAVPGGPDCLQAVPGFILALSTEGKLIYISENTEQYLGYSMVDLVAQGDCFYDLIDSSDVKVVQECLQLGPATPGTEVSFVCQMLTSKAFRLRYGGNCAVLVKGRFLSIPDVSSSSPSTFLMVTIFSALCTPIMHWSKEEEGISQPSFQTQHSLDMSFREVSDSVIYYLGYKREELIGQSWYSLVHPEDLLLAASQHRILVAGVGDVRNGELVVRLQCKDLSWAWISARVQRFSNSQSVTCTNYIIGETEAKYLRQQSDDGRDHMNTAQTYSQPPRLLQQDLSLATSNLTVRLPGYTTKDGSSELSHQGKPSSVRKRKLETISLDDEPLNKSKSPPEPKLYSSYVNSSDFFYPKCCSGESADMVFSVFTPPYSPESDTSSFLFSQSSCSPTQSDKDLSGDAYNCLGTLPATHEQVPCHSLSNRSSDPMVLHFIATLEPPLLIKDNASPINPFSISQNTTERFPLSPLSPASYIPPSSPLEVPLVPELARMADVSSVISDSEFHPEDYGIPDSLSPDFGSLDPYVSAQSPGEALLVPEESTIAGGSPVSENSFQYTEKEKNKISILAKQISCLAESFSVYKEKNMTVGPKESGPLNWPQPNIKHQVSSLPTSRMKNTIVSDDGFFLEEVFESILKELDAPHPDSGVPCSSTTSPEPASPDISSCGSSHCMSNMKNEDCCGFSKPPSVGLCPEEDFLDELVSAESTVFSCVLRSPCDGFDHELHQLNEYLCSDLQPDECMETSLF